MPIVPAAASARKDIENAIYEAWKAAEGATKDALWAQLRDAVQGHAEAVSYSILRRYEPELIQDAVNRVMHGLYGFEEESAFTTWAHAIISHRMYDERRLERRRKEVSMEAIGFDMPGDPSIEQSNLLLTVEKVLDEEQHQLFEQIVLLGKSHEEAAEALEMPRQTLSRKWSEAKKVLEHAFSK